MAQWVQKSRHDSTSVIHKLMRKNKVYKLFADFMKELVGNNYK
jgi:hypothetical protein